MESNSVAGPADVGVVLIRQYYLRVVSTRDGSPAARAGLRTGDFIRGIDDKPTRNMSAFEGARLLQGSPGSRVKLLVFRGNAAEPHDVVLTRERPAGTDVTSRMANPTTGYVRVTEFTKDHGRHDLQAAIDTLAKSGASRYVVDLRGTATRRPRRRRRGRAALREGRHAGGEGRQDAAGSGGGRRRRRRHRRAGGAASSARARPAPPKCSPRRSTATIAPT